MRAGHAEQDVHLLERRVQGRQSEVLGAADAYRERAARVAEVEPPDARADAFGSQPAASEGKGWLEHGADQAGLCPAAAARVALAEVADLNARCRVSRFVSASAPARLPGTQS